MKMTAKPSFLFLNETHHHDLRRKQMFNFLCIKFCLNILLQEKRDLIVEELVSTEQLYVETLHMLVEVSTYIWYL